MMMTGRSAKRMPPSRLKLKFDRALQSFNDMVNAMNISTSETRKLEQNIKNLQEQLLLVNKEVKLCSVKHQPEIKASKKKERVANRAQKEQINENQQKILLMKRNQEKLEAKRAKERDRILFEAERKKVIPTRHIDESTLIKVQLDRNTAVFIKPGQDPEEVKRKFRNRHTQEKF